MIFHFILFSFLLFPFITVRVKYDVWYTDVLIDSLQVIHMIIPFQVNPHRIGLCEFCDSRIWVLKNNCLGGTIIAVHASLCGLSRIALNYYHWLVPLGVGKFLFLKRSLMCYYSDHAFNPNRVVHMVSIFEWDDVQSSFYMLNHLEGVLLQFLTKLRDHSLLPHFLPMNG